LAVDSRALMPETEFSSQPFEFYLVCAPGFEDVSERELRAWFPGLEPRRARGGLSLEAPLGVGYAMNRVLKTPTRVLLRLMTFGCRDFPKLYKKISGFPWEEWLSDQSRIAFHAAAHGSRLKIKTRIEETCWEARVARLKKRGRPHSRFEGPPADVYVRLDDDVCTLSLDTSGEILHKRGVRVFSSQAPLRETTAAAVLWWLRELSPQAKDVEILDPMMGAGTFLLEAAGLMKKVETRAFAFEKFTAQCPEESALAPAPFIGRLRGFDIDARAYAAARENLALAKGEDRADIVQGDFFAVQPLDEAPHRWVVCNPPYDERIAVDGSLGGFYEKLLAQVERVARPELAAFLFPADARPEKLRLPSGWRKREARRFSNGGIEVWVMVYGPRL